MSEEGEEVFAAFPPERERERKASPWTVRVDFVLPWVTAPIPNPGAFIRDREALVVPWEELALSLCYLGCGCAWSWPWGAHGAAGDDPKAGTRPFVRGAPQILTVPTRAGSGLGGQI